MLEKITIYKETEVIDVIRLGPDGWTSWKKHFAQYLNLLFPMDEYSPADGEKGHEEAFIIQSEFRMAGYTVEVEYTEAPVEEGVVY